MARRYGQIGLTEPDDIVQCAMVKLLNKKDSKYPTLGWLYKAVRYSALDAGRIASRDERAIWRHPQDDLRCVCERADQHGHLQNYGSYVVREDDREIDLMPRLIDMLEKLSKPLKQVLVLYAEGYSYLEIGRLTNTRVGTVRSRLHYARRQARALLGDMG